MTFQPPLNDIAPASSACLLWRPTVEEIQAANLAAFQRYVADRWQIALTDYKALHDWSIGERGQFWEWVWDFCNVTGDWNRKTDGKSCERMPGARWFPGGWLNFA